jgi:hypothetical protein
MRLRGDLAVEYDSATGKYTLTNGTDEYKGKLVAGCLSPDAGGSIGPKIVFVARYVREIEIEIEIMIEIEK